MARTKRLIAKTVAEDMRVAAVAQDRSRANAIISASAKTSRDSSIRTRLHECAAATKILFESMRAREGFFVCEVTNESDAPAHVFIQLNKGNFYGGSGLVGVVIKLISSIFRMSHLSLGH